MMANLALRGLGSRIAALEVKMIRKFDRVLLALVLGALLALPTTARASDYPLENVLPKEAAEKLAKQGVTTTAQLLAKGAKRAARKQLVKATGLAAKQLLTWIEMSDVMRIKGVGPEMAKLLRAAKVRRVAKLRRQRAKTLLARMLKANKTKKISQNPPNEGQVKHWIGLAKKLKIVLK
jgi:hypothetical protein